MKKYLIILIGCFFCLSLRAQTETDKNWFSVAYNNNQHGSALRIPFKGIISAKSYGLTVGLDHYLSRSFDLSITLSYGEVYDSEVSFTRGTLFGGQVIGKFKFNNGSILPEDSKLAPYLGLGIGVLSFTNTAFMNEEGTDLVGSPIVGVDYRVNDHFKIFASASYKINNNIAYREFSLGAGFALGRKADSDGDGIPDRKDECPLDFGPADNDGCPYPDRDGDGVVDTEDKCPDAAGTANGCPDSDGDGVPDIEDKCPEQAGADGGCPEVVDTDGDGVPDAEDKCPNEAGAFSGCKTDPDAPVTQEEKPVEKDTTLIRPVTGPDRSTPVDVNEIYRLPLEFIAFNPGSDLIRPEQKAALDQLAEMMLFDESFKVELNGYGDRNLTSEENFELARQRVVAVRNYLIRKGISPYRFINSIRGTPRATGTAGRVVVRAL